MEIDNQRHNDSVTARAYIRNMADQFEDPEDMLAFLNACDKTQAALVHWLFQQNRYAHIQLTHINYLKYDSNSSVEMEIAWDEYCNSYEMLKQAKEHLKEIVCKLNVNFAVSE